MSESNENSNRLRPDERYARDATFACLVNTLEQVLWTCDYTPTEIREAAMLAAIRYEQRKVPNQGHRCTCKKRYRDHEPECWWHMKREENDFSARMAMADQEKIYPRMG